MKGLYVRVVLAFTLMATLASACVDVKDIVAYCDHVVGRYSYDFNDTVDNYITIRTDDGSLAAHQHVQVPAHGTDGEDSVTVKLNQTYPNGTHFTVYESGNSSSDGIKIGDDTCSNEGHHVTWFEPGDNRLNRQAYAYAAIYCDDANQRVGIYGIHTQTAGDQVAGQGYPAIFVPYALLPATPTGGNVLIQQYQNIGFYRLNTGEYQVNAGPDAEGKTYVVTFDGCPTSIMHAYMMQNGVMTETEVYPHQ